MSSELGVRARCANCGERRRVAGRGRCAGCYRYLLRNGTDHVTRRRGAVLVALEAGVLSEGQAARLLAVDRLRVRHLREEAREAAAAIWKAHRGEQADRHSDR